MEALLHKDAETLDRTAGAIRGRALRVCNVVDSDMELHQPSAYTDRVKDAVLMERKKGEKLERVCCKCHWYMIVIVFFSGTGIRIESGFGGRFIEPKSPGWGWLGWIFRGR